MYPEPGNHRNGFFRGCVFIQHCEEHYVIFQKQLIKETDERCVGRRKNSIKDFNQSWFAFKPKARKGIGSPDSDWSARV